MVYCLPVVGSVFDEPLLSGQASPEADADAEVELDVTALDASADDTDVDVILEEVEPWMVELLDDMKELNEELDMLPGTLLEVTLLAVLDEAARVNVLLTLDELAADEDVVLDILVAGLDVDMMVLDVEMLDDNSEEV